MFFLLLSVAAIAIATAFPESTVPTQTGVAYFDHYDTTYVIYVASCQSASGTEHQCIQAAPYSSFGVATIPTFCLTWYNGNKFPSLKQNGNIYTQDIIGSYQRFFDQGPVLVTLDGDYKLVFNYVGSLIPLTPYIVFNSMVTKLTSIKLTGSASRA